MATVYSNAIPAPDFLEADGSFNHAAYDGRCEAYEAETRDYIARMCYTGDLSGYIISFPVADGSAKYMVAHSKGKLALIHLDEVDGYHANHILLRGLNLSDVRAMIKQEQAIAALFNRE